MSVHGFFPRLVLGITCALAALHPLAAAVAQPMRPAAALAVNRMAGAAGAEPLVTLSKTGLVSFLRTAPGARIPLDQPGSAEERARAFLDEYGDAFGLVPGVEMVTVGESPADEVGMEHVRFRQTYRGVPIAGGEAAVHLRGQGVVAVHAKTLSDLRGVDLVPRVTADEAEVLARDALARHLGVIDAVLSEPRLELLNKGLLGGRGFTTELTWFVEARRIDLREYLWIDARAGKVALQFSQLTDARDRQVFDADDPGDGAYGTLPGALVRSEGGPAVGGAAAVDANAAYDYAGDTYDYFHDQHGRDSYDGAGATLSSTVRYCPSAGDCPYANAFWNGVQMVYGAGFPVADDVDAHELTHAVTEHTAGLFYYMQSGALNESFSDVFGETVDLLNGSGTDTPAVRWKMGEDVPGFGAIRDMADPTVFDDPGKTSDPEFVCADDWRGDRGGVHSNSGVPNKAYVLMVDGGSYNGHTVSGLGLAKAGKVQYRALSRYLLSASDFLDDYDALLQSCQDLVGTAGITAADCSQVEKALDAVEMNQTWPCSPAQAAVPDFCPAGEAPELWYYEDFEGEVVGVPDCLTNNVAAYWCVNQPSSLLGAFATSGERSLWAYDPPSAGTLWFWRNFLEMPPAGARLQFNHSHGFDNSGATYFDGGHVVVSTNGGTSFSNAQWLISAGDAYSGILSSCCGNPYGGLAALVGDTWGYTATQLDLSSLSGTAFSYGFVLASDSAVDEFGWWVDDVRIYTCGECMATRTLDAGYTGMASHYKAASSITAGNGFTVEHGEAVTLEAGSVVLESGFRAVGDLTVITGSGSCP